MRTLFVLILAVGSYCGLYSQIIFEDDFESGIFQPSWTIHTNISGDNGLVEIADDVGVNDSKGVKIGKSDNSPLLTTNALDLHLNLDGYTQVALEFDLAKYWDDTHPEDGIFFSDDNGNTFEKVVNFAPDNWCSSTYGSFPLVYVSKLAEEYDLDLNNNFIIRFQQAGIKEFSGVGDGFYLDNVMVFDPQFEYASLPFTEDFESGSFSASCHQSIPFNTSFIGHDPASPMSRLEILPGEGVNDSYGLLIGKICDGGDTVSNALDFLLNLQDKSSVFLSFWMASYFENYQEDEGIYFSDNGGETFIKVLNFFPDEWCNNEYGEHPPISIDEIADQFGLTLSDEFIIRIQQSGKQTFQNTGDGIFLDSVSVYERPIVYKSPPFSDDLESGLLENHWRWSFAENTTQDQAGSSHTSFMNHLSVKEGIGVDESFGLRLGQDCDGNPTTNAADLHLNLAGQSQVTLYVQIADIFDENDPDDALFISVNGGQTFEKVFEFDFFNTPNYEFQNYTFNLSDLAQSNGLVLTDQTIVRFQQRGNKDFEGTFSDADGIIIDNLGLESISSTSEITSINVSIFPNPSDQDLLQVQMDQQLLEEGFITLIANDGRVILTQNIAKGQDTFELQIPEIPAGFYTLQLISGNQKFLTKLVRM
ncbi:MAG: T9SS type A sorting domain-containing protein [Bacteroidetes bacterium]|nr:T9SS type A sorting domain-containing protein [Bacteroidota bacterium]